MSGTSGCLTTSNIFIVGRTIPFDDERPNNEKNLLSCLSDTTTERIAMKHKGDDSGMNSFAVKQFVYVSFAAAVWKRGF